MAEEKTPSASDRRTLRGLLVKPKQQVKYSFMFMGGSMMILTLFIGAAIYTLRSTVEGLRVAYNLDEAVANTILSSLTTTLTLTLLISIILSAFAFLIGIQLSHRLYGPLVPIQAHIKKMKQGDFATRIHLRRGDELIELQDSLNDLAQTFEAKYPRT